MQAPAGDQFQMILTGVAGLGFAVVVVGLITGLIPPPRHVMADSSHIVSIYFDGQEKVVSTNAPTVGAALQESGITLSVGDEVEPAPQTNMPEGFFNVNIYRARPVLVTEGSMHRTINTASQIPSQIATQAGFKVYPEDGYSVSTITNVAAAGTVGQQVTIQPSVPVEIISDGQSQSVRTLQKTVGGLLHERDVALGPQDTVVPGSGATVVPNMTVQINRVADVVQKETTAIPFATQNINDPTLNAGTTHVSTAGSNGQEITTYRVHYQNGVEQSRQQLAQVVTQQPTTQVVKVGTKIDYSANPVGLGQQMAAARGWTGAQWNALYSLWEHESGWNPSSSNGSTGACGIPQAYPCSKITDHSTAGQITWGLNYIAGKYGTPASAYAYWQSHHSY